MEVTDIEKIQNISRVRTSAVANVQTEVCDVCTISDEALKRSEWVEMLKQMPPIRDETLLAAGHTPLEGEALKIVAQKMANEG